MEIDLLQNTVNTLIKQNTKVYSELRSVRSIVDSLRSSIWATKESDNIPDVDTTIDDNSNIVKDWSMCEYVGEGASGKVFKCSKTDGTVGVIKKIPKKKVGTIEKYNSLNREISCLKRFQSSHYCPSFFGAFQSHLNMYIIMEDCGLDLHQYSNDNNFNHTTEVIQNVLFLTCCGIRLIQSHNIVHHDIKPENILLKLDDVKNIVSLKLADFGSSVLYKDDSLSRAVCGTFGFSPPEQILTQSHDPFKADVWSLACVILEMVQGQDWFVNTWTHIWKKHYMEAFSDTRVFSSLLTSAILDVKSSCFDEYFKESLVIDADDRNSIDQVFHYNSPEQCLRTL